MTRKKKMIMSKVAAQTVSPPMTKAMIQMESHRAATRIQAEIRRKLDSLKTKMNWIPLSVNKL